MKVTTNKYLGKKIKLRNDKFPELKTSRRKKPQLVIINRNVNNDILEGYEERRYEITSKQIECYGCTIEY